MLEKLSICEVALSGFCYFSVVTSLPYSDTRESLVKIWPHLSSDLVELAWLDLNIIEQ